MAISFIKSFNFTRSNYEGYSNKMIEPDTVSDNEADDGVYKDKLTSKKVDKYVSQSGYELTKQLLYKPRYGGPFSSLTPSMWPQDLLAAYSQPEDLQPNSHYDEYGFVQSSQQSDVDSSPLHDDVYNQTDTEDCGEEGFVSKNESELRNKWIAYLEFTYNQAANPRMVWSQVELQIRHTKVLDQLVKDGLPATMRAQLWSRFSKAIVLRTNSKLNYAQMCDQSNHVGPIADKQILSVLPTNACFMHSTSVGIERLRRILRVIKWLHRSGSNPLSTHNDTVNIPVIAAYLLLFCDEEDAFWLTLSCLNELKTFDHQNILKKLISNYCTSIDELLKKDGLEIALITSHWFSSLFAGYLTPTSVLLQLWDYYFYYGSIVLFQVTVGLLIETSYLFEDCNDTAIFFNQLSDLPSHINDCDRLIAYWETGARYVDHVKQDRLSLNLMNMNGLGASLLALPTFSNDIHEQDPKTKNIRQTSLLLELHESIVAIGRHFESYDSKFKANLDPDYSNVDKYNDDGDYNDESNRLSLRRAKALIDFQRHDPDELGFRKNDIITILSERDEHCWVGELNGVQGWFPAKFVELLDERNGTYNVAGDDRVVPYINDLVRGRFCSALKAILSHGLRKTLFIAVHPWNIVETIISSCIETDFNSVYSRLVLTRTFRLDEFARVLTPTEILYRSVSHINQILEYEPMDVKLRSLICIGLNQKILHEWFSIICATQPHILSKYYYTWGFINNPVWKMIRAEIK